MRIKSAAGYSLLEVLIAIALLAVAMLSFARLQAATIHASRQAIATELIEQLAVELAEWIRSGRPAATLLAAINEQDVPTALSCYRQNCTPQQFAHFEWHEWQQRVLRIAPAARISVCRSDHIPLSDWHCDAEGSLRAPLIIRIGWPLPAQAHDFPAALAIIIGPVPP